jgi:predicted nucleic acid-binding protein
LILADSNLLSETSKQDPDRKVVGWIAARLSQLYIPTPALSELRYGCEKLPQSKKRSKLETWLGDLMIQLEDRILPFDRDAAEVHGTLRARLRAMGKPCPPTDSYIAAMALSYDCPVATRNVEDFQWTGVVILNPWEA